MLQWCNRQGIYIFIDFTVEIRLNKVEKGLNKQKVNLNFDKCYEEKHSQI